MATLAELATRIGQDIKALRTGKVNTLDARLTDARTPTAHQHAVGQVTGLQAIIDRLTYDTGWRDVSALLQPGLAKSTNLGRCNIKWAGGRIYIDMNLNITETAITNVMNLPGEYRPDVPIIVPFNFWTTTTANSALPTSLASGYMGAGGSSIRVNGLPNPGTAAIFLDLPAQFKTPPTTFPGPLA